MNRSIKCHEAGADTEEALQLSLTETGRGIVVEYSFEFLEDFQEECPNIACKIPCYGKSLFRYRIGIYIINIYKTLLKRMTFVTKSIKARWSMQAKAGMSACNNEIRCFYRCMPSPPSLTYRLN